MSNPWKQPWSDNPNAPKIPHFLYFEEKAYFAGILIASILYGTLIVLFFQCMAGLFNPANRRTEGIKWGLVTYTAAMFSFVTISTGMVLNAESVAYIDNREFPGVEGAYPVGPMGYQAFIRSRPLGMIPSLMFFLNNWLADGLLLYRCHVTYSMNLWIIAFPCLAYLASVGMGIALLASMALERMDTVLHFGLPYLSISISLNVLLTLMIVVRLVLHSRSIRAAMGTSSGIGSLYRATVAMLIESSALYAVSSLLVIGLWVARGGAAEIFLPILCEAQVIAPLLIIKQVANRHALTCNTVVAGHAGSFRAEPERGDSALPYGYPMSPVDEYEKHPSELEVRIETTFHLRRDSEV